MSEKKIKGQGFFSRLATENPVFATYLGICSTLAITTSLNSAIGMGVAVIVVLTLSNILVSLIEFGDTESVGDQATKAAELEKYKGVTLESKVDSTTGATFTSTSLRAMITTALQAATK